MPCKMKTLFASVPPNQLNVFFFPSNQILKYKCILYHFNDLLVHIGILYTCMSTWQKKALDPIRLQLWATLGVLGFLTAWSISPSLHLLFGLVWFLRQGLPALSILFLTMYIRLPCLCHPSAGIKGVHHHTQPGSICFNSYLLEEAYRQEN